MGTGSFDTTGHIPGAFELTPLKSLARNDNAELEIQGMLKNQPTNQTIVVYCWTGQHSSQITAALNMMGYTAKSLTYGANKLMHSSLSGHKWSDTNVMNYDLVPSK